MVFYIITLVWRNTAAICRVQNESRSSIFIQNVFKPVPNYKVS